MKLAHNWRDVLRHAWSIRLMLLAALLSGLEVALPYLGDLPVSAGVFALLSLAVTASAFVARFVAQEKLGGRDE